MSRASNAAAPPAPNYVTMHMIEFPGGAVREQLTRTSTTSVFCPETGRVAVLPRASAPRYRSKAGIANGPCYHPPPRDTDLLVTAM